MKDTSAQKVLNQIKSSQAQIHSRLRLAADRFGLESVGFLMFLIAVISITLFLFWLRVNDALFWFSFGSIGIWAFLEAFPYLWMIIALIALLVILAAIKTLNLYAKPLPRRLVFLLAIFALGLSSAAAFSGATEKFLENPKTQKLRSLNPISNLTEHRGEKGIVGTVIKQNSQEIDLSVNGNQIKIRINRPEITPVKLAPGDRIFVVSPSTRAKEIEAIGVRRLKRILTPKINHLIPNERIIIPPVYYKWSRGA